MLLSRYATVSTWILLSGTLVFLDAVCAGIQEHGVTRENKKAEPCCAPSQWEGDLYTTSAAVGEPNATLHLRVGSMEIHWDYPGMRMALDHTITDRDSIIHYTVIDNYLAKVRAVIRDGNCTLQALNHTMRESCIPANATAVFSGYIGGLTERLDVITWQSYLPSGGNEGPPGPPSGWRGYRQFTSTAQDCIPFGYLSQQMNSNNTESFTLMGGFQRITTGIRDTDVFTIPQDCYDSGLELLPIAMEHALTILTSYI